MNAAAAAAWVDSGANALDIANVTSGSINGACASGDWVIDDNEVLSLDRFMCLNDDDVNFSTDFVQSER